MTRFLFSTIPATGHVTPALPIARKLVEWGHEVWWYTGQLFQARIEETGARYVPIRAGIDFSDPKKTDWYREVTRNLTGLKRLKFDLKHAFGDSALGQVQDLTDVLQEFPADVLISEFGSLGASWIYEKGGPPWAALGITVLPFPSRDVAPFGLGLPPNASSIGRLRNRFLQGLTQQLVLNEVTSYFNQLRDRIGLPLTSKSFFDALLSPFLYLQGTIPEFEYPRSDLPPQVHFIGPLLPTSPAAFTPPSWWHELKGKKPVIHVTQGTIATEANDLIIPTLQGLANEEVLAIATTGNGPIASVKVDPLPANARIELFLPYSHLLPHVDVMVTNGGYGGVQMALANGIPLVTVGHTEDKPEICTRVEWAGVGINLKAKRTTPTQIKEAVKEVMASPRYRQKAREFQAIMARSDAATQAVTLLEQLATTKQPVLRSS